MAYTTQQISQFRMDLNSGNDALVKNAQLVLGSSYPKGAPTIFNASGRPALKSSVDTSFMGILNAQINKPISERTTTTTQKIQSIAQTGQVNFSSLTPIQKLGAIGYSYLGDVLGKLSNPTPSQVQEIPIFINPITWLPITLGKSFVQTGINQLNPNIIPPSQQGIFTPNLPQFIQPTTPSPLGGVTMDTSTTEKKGFFDNYGTLILVGVSALALGMFLNRK